MTTICIVMMIQCEIANNVLCSLNHLQHKYNNNANLICMKDRIFLSNSSCTHTSRCVCLCLWSFWHSLSNCYTSCMGRQCGHYTEEYTILIALVCVRCVVLFSLFALYAVMMAYWSLYVFLLLLSCDEVLLKKKKSAQTLSRGKIRRSPSYHA